MTYKFTSVARLPSADDNVAIATQRLDAGIQIQQNSQQFTLSHTVLEGHRFAIQPIAEGAPLLSWGLPFGYASRSIDPGNYVCNQKMIDSLSIRNLNFDLPSTPNFTDMMVPYALDETEFSHGKQVEPHANDRNFLGYQRPGKSRGWNAELHRCNGNNVTHIRFCQTTCGQMCQHCRCIFQYRRYRFGHTY